MLTDSIEEREVVAIQELLERHNTGVTFLRRILKGDETWVNHYELEGKKNQ